MWLVGDFFTPNYGEYCAFVAVVVIMLGHGFGSLRVGKWWVDNFDTAMTSQNGNF